MRPPLSTVTASVHVRRQNPATPPVATRFVAQSTVARPYKPP